MDVEVFAQIFHGDGSGLDMPGGAGVAPFGFIKDSLFQLRKGGSLHQCEVAGVVFFIFIQIHGGTESDFVDIDAREFAIAGKSGNIKVDGAKFFVGKSFFGEPLSQAYHVVDIFTGSWGILRGSDGQQRQVSLKPFQLPLGEVRPGQGCRPVSAPSMVLSSRSVI